MSSPACADGYDTPAQQREDSTTFMLSQSLSDSAGESPSDGHGVRRWPPGPGAVTSRLNTCKFSRQPERLWLTPRPGPGRLKAVLSQAERNLNKALNRGIPSSEPEICAVHVPGTVTMMMSRD